MTTNVPTKLTKGDTAEFTTSSSEHSNSLWNLSLVLSGNPSPEAFAASAGTGGNDFDFEVLVVDTLPGSVPWFILATEISTSKRVTLAQGILSVLPDPVAAVPTSWAQDTLVIVKAAIKKLAAGTSSMVNINGQQFTKKNLNELMKFHDTLEDKVNKEQTALGRSNKGSQQIIRTRFI